MYLKINQPDHITHDYNSGLNQNVREEIEVSEIELRILKNQYKNNSTQSFFDYANEATHPLFVFKNKEIVYWSKNAIVPTFNDIENIQDKEVKKINENLELIIRKTYLYGKDTLDFVSMIDLYHSYRTNNEYLKSNYNVDIFSPTPERIAINPYVGGAQVKDNAGKTLFYYNIAKQDDKLNSSIPNSLLWLFNISILLISIHILILVRHFFRTHKFGVAFLTLFCYLIGLRIFMVYTGIPFFLFRKGFGNPKNFASSFYTPTFMDSLIHNFFLLIFLLFFAVFFNRSRIFYRLLKSEGMLKNMYAVFLVLIVFITTYFCLNKFEMLYFKSDYDLGLTLSLEFTITKMLITFYYIIILVIFFFVSHVCIYTFIKLQRNKKTAFLNWLYAVLVGYFVLLVFGTPNFGYLIAAAYFWAVYFFELPSFFYAFRFKSVIYYILAAFCFALMSSELVFNLETQKNLIQQRKFANRYISDNDPTAEGLLEKFSKEIKSNPQIINALERKILASENISNIIKESYLDIYFDKFNTNILSFDNQGQNLNGLPNTLNDYKSIYDLQKYKTEVPNLSFINLESDSLNQNQYVLFSDIFKETQKVGSVMMIMKINNDQFESNYSNLVTSKKFVENPDIQNFSYGIYNAKKDLKLSSGAYNYNLYFPKKLLYKNDLYNSSYEYHANNHLGVLGKNQNTIVVSQPIIGIKNTVSNFAYLFLLSIIGFSTLFFVFSFFFGIKDFSMNLSSKIQLYLNGAFFFPLIIIILLTISVVRSTLISIQNKTYRDNAKNIANTFLLHLNNFSEGKSSKDYFETEVNKLSRDTKLDINFYDTKGYLNFTTRPLVFQYNLISNYINPSIERDLINNKEEESLITESIGNLEFKTVYYALKDKQNKLLGVVGIPFFNSKPILDSQIKQVVSTILVIFLGMFMLLILLSYLASKELISPLKIITQKLRRTNLDKLDEPIEWKTNDEIGLLTKTYNKMLLKLNESKIALSQTEKQTAWQEMAKQVAHEIKNPLTPMKLSIQQLQRTLPQDPESKGRIERALSSLNEQIDNISEIANSFSEFAKMPVPRSEVFDLVSICRKTIDLYSENNNIKINFTTFEKVVFVKSDRLLISRVITNLLINAIQAVPPIRMPLITVSIGKNDENSFAILEVSDNGSGIPEAIHKKVFIPNFTTKVGGSGLGLAMAKRGIEHGGGNIWFETVEGEGTTFYVDIPMA